MTLYTKEDQGFKKTKQRPWPCKESFLSSFLFPSSSTQPRFAPCWSLGRMQLGSCDHLLCTVLAEELKMWKHWLQTAVTSEVRVSPFCLHPAKNAHVQLSDCFTKAKVTKSSLKSILPFFFLAQNNKQNNPKRL